MAKGRIGRRALGAWEAGGHRGKAMAGKRKESPPRPSLGGLPQGTAFLDGLGYNVSMAV